MQKEYVSYIMMNSIIKDVQSIVSTNNVYTPVQPAVSTKWIATDYAWMFLAILAVVVLLKLIRRF